MIPYFSINLYPFVFALNKYPFPQRDVQYHNQMSKPEFEHEGHRTLVQINMEATEKVTQIIRTVHAHTKKVPCQNLLDVPFRL